MSGELVIVVAGKPETPAHRAAPLSAWMAVGDAFLDMVELVGDPYRDEMWSGLRLEALALATEAERLHATLAFFAD